MGERWHVGEVAFAKVAVRDENAILVGWVSGSNVELVAAAPAMLDLLRALLEGIARHPAAVAHTPAFLEAQALVAALGRERDLCGACEGSAADELGDPCAACGGHGLVTVHEETAEGAAVDGVEI